MSDTANVLTAELLTTFECSECGKINVQVLMIRKGLYRNPYREATCHHCKERLEICLSEFIVRRKGIYDKYNSSQDLDLYC